MLSGTSHTLSYAAAARERSPYVSSTERAAEPQQTHAHPDSTASSAASDASSPAVVNHVRPAGSLPASGSADAPEQSGEASEAAESEAHRADSEPPEQGKTDKAEDEEANAEEIRRLQARDTEVRAHEQAHAAAGGELAGAPSYKFERGPDGRNYAVSGEVPIDISPVDGDPEATIRKMEKVKRAALAPESPSGADHSIAASADSQIAAARQELNTRSAQGDQETEPGRDTAAEASHEEGHEEGKDDARMTAVDRDGFGQSPQAGDLARGAFEAFSRRSAGAGSYGAAPLPDAGSVLNIGA